MEKAGGITDVRDCIKKDAIDKPKWRDAVNKLSRIEVNTATSK